MADKGCNHYFMEGKGYCDECVNAGVPEKDDRIAELEQQLSEALDCLGCFPGHHVETAYNMWLNMRDRIIASHTKTETVDG